METVAPMKPLIDIVQSCKFEYLDRRGETVWSYECSIEELELGHWSHWCVKVLERSDVLAEGRLPLIEQVRTSFITVSGEQIVRSQMKGSFVCQVVKDQDGATLKYESINSLSFIEQAAHSEELEGVELMGFDPDYGGALLWGARGGSIALETTDLKQGCEGCLEYMETYLDFCVQRHFEQRSNSYDDITEQRCPFEVRGYMAKLVCSAGYLGSLINKKIFISNFYEQLNVLLPEQINASKAYIPAAFVYLDPMVQSCAQQLALGNHKEAKVYLDQWTRDHLRDGEAVFGQMDGQTKISIVEFLIHLNAHELACEWLQQHVRTREQLVEILRHKNVWNTDALDAAILGESLEVLSYASGHLDSKQMQKMLCEKEWENNEDAVQKWMKQGFVREHMNSNKRSYYYEKKHFLGCNDRWDLKTVEQQLSQLLTWMDHGKGLENYMEWSKRYFEGHKSHPKIEQFLQKCHLEQQISAEPSKGVRLKHI